MVINPLVNWIWVGFGIMALGTGIALLPERAYSFAVARLPAEAATTTTALLAAAARRRAGDACPRAAFRVGHDGAGRCADARSNATMQKRLICMCRDCGRQLLSAASAATRSGCARSWRSSLPTARSEQEIVDYYLAKYGSQEPLAEPIDRGFNRLAWAVPYLVGAGGLALVGIGRREVVASPRSRRRAAGSSRASALPTPSSNRGWTMSSATSTDRASTSSSAQVLRARARRDRRSCCGQAAAHRCRIVALTLLGAGPDGRGAVSRRSSPFDRERRRHASIGGRRRAALERDKLLTLRSIKELEFDRAMGKVSEADFVEMRDRLRARALRLMRQLEGAALYQQMIERDVQAAGGGERQAAVARSKGCVRVVRRRSTTSTRGSARSAGNAWPGALVIGRSAAHATASLAVAADRALCAARRLSARRCPIPRQMSGQVLPAADLPTGSVTVRVIRQTMANAVPGITVELHGAAMSGAR